MRKLNTEKLNWREDDFSIQITAKTTPRLFIRLLTPKPHCSVMTFTDFILSSDDSPLALDALTLLRTKIHIPASGMKLIFLNIYPSHRSKKDKQELVRVHDKITSIVKEFAAQNGLIVENSFLEVEAEKFHSIVVLN